MGNVLDTVGQGIVDTFDPSGGAGNIGALVGAATGIGGGIVLVAIVIIALFLLLAACVFCSILCLCVCCCLFVGVCVCFMFCDCIVCGVGGIVWKRIKKRLKSRNRSPEDSDAYSPPAISSDEDYESECDEDGYGDGDVYSDGDGDDDNDAGGYEEPDY